MDVPFWIWAMTVAAVLGMLALDLVGHVRTPHAPGLRESALWSAGYVGVAVVFGLVVLAVGGAEPGGGYFAAYLTEKSLSVDNLFVFVLLFRAFAIPPQYQHRVLFWGIIGALLLRGALILAGVALVHRFHWVVAVFGAILVYTAIKILFHEDVSERVPSDNAVVRWVARQLPLTKTIEGPEFFRRIDGRLFATPLFLAIVAAETTDLIFALDSVPAVFAVTDDSFLVFSSNICAVLGLRALYFVLRGMLTRLRYLKPGLAAILIFVGSKMLLFRWVHLPTGTSLLIIAAILAAALLFSWFKGPQSAAE